MSNKIELPRTAKYLAPTTNSFTKEITGAWIRYVHSMAKSRMSIDVLKREQRANHLILIK